MLAPNLGEDLKPLAKIASGGELSRVMLAIEAVLAEAEQTPTIIFDEIDAGIGGRTAVNLGESCVPQQAAAGAVRNSSAGGGQFGTQHYSVQKSSQQGRTVVRVELLSPRKG